MCGRASTTFTAQELAIRYRRPLVIPDLRPNYNLCPTQNTVILRVVENERQFDSMRFGLIPAWADSVQAASRYSLINAKSEEVMEKRSYKVPFQKQRAIMPVSSFFEWQNAGTGHKRPYCIKVKNEAIMSLAAIWEHWKSKDGSQEVYSFAIMTTEANEFMARIHNRIPVILAREDEEKWLDPENTDVKSLQALCKSCPSEWLEAYEVSTLVNSPKHNTPEVLQPV